MNEDALPRHEMVSFREALRFWIRLGFINFGGPAGQIAIMHRELVEKRKWISEERFLHALNFCMLLPGPEAQQLAIYIGWLKHGVRGGLAAGIFFVLPGFFLITGISVLYALYHSLPVVNGVLFGLKCAVLAIVVEAVIRIGKRALKSRLHWAIAGAAFVGIFIFSVPFPLIVLGAAVLGLILRQSNAQIEATEVAAPRSQARSALQAALVCALLWFIPVVLVAVLLGGTHVLTQEGVFFSKMAVVTFGGAYAVLAYVAQEAVSQFGWLNSSDMLQGLALAETTPGPLILVLTFVGFVGAYNVPGSLDPLTAGLLGAFITTWVTFVPCFLWIFLGAPYVEKLRHNAALSSALSMVTAAVVGVIVNLSVWFALHVLFRGGTVWRGFGFEFAVPKWSTLDGSALLIAAVAMFALLRLRVPMLWVLGMSAILGVVLKFQSAIPA